MYLTYDKYKEFGGTLDETAFNEYAFEACLLVDWYTFNRLRDEEEYPEAVQRCVYKLIKIAQLKAEAYQLGDTGNSGDETSSSTVTSGSPIQSQSNDGVSISYNTMSAGELFEKSDTEMKKAMDLYLNGLVNSRGLKLTYRGMYPKEELVRRF